MRVLVCTAILLGGLLVGVILLGLDRLGHLQSWSPTDWEFKNHVIEVPLGTRVVLRSMNAKAPQERFWFGRKDTDPRVDPRSPPKPGDIPPLPHVLVGRETRVEGEREWYYVPPVSFVLLGLMGARSTTEWLEEIRPVRERLPDGGHRVLLRASYGQQNGGRVSYFYDPDEPAASPRGFGWLRMEAFAKDLAEVSFAVPAGRTLPGK